MLTPGFRIPVHRALLSPLLLAGVPRRFAMINGTICCAFVLGLHAFYTLPIFILIHLTAVYLTKRDPDFFEVLIRRLRRKNYYNV